MNKKTGKGIQFVMTGGISMVLLIFAVLLLVSFASLSISAARADLRLSERYETASENYYSARNQAQEFLAELDAQLKSDSTLQTLSSSLSFTIVSQKDLYTWTIEKDFPAGENAQLALTAEIRIPGRSAASQTSGAAGSGRAFSIRVLSEKLQATQNFDYDGHLNVIQ